MAVDPSHIATQRLAQLNRQVRLADSTPLTTEEFVDMLIPMSSEQRSELKKISVLAAPFPLHLHEKMGDGGYFTYDFTDLSPLFKGLALERMELIDPYHCGSGDPFGHEATYTMVEYFVKGIFNQGKGWKELTFRSYSDVWLRGRMKSLKPVNNSEGYFWAQDGLLDASGHDLCPEDCTEISNREVERSGPKIELQPMALDRAIKERDGPDSGARVEMWIKTPTYANGEWKKIGTEGHIPKEESRMIMVEYDKPDVEIRIRRGTGVDYVEDGIWDTKWRLDEENKYLFDMFNSLGGEDMKKRGLFIQGAEDDPNSHL